MRIYALIALSAAAIFLLIRFVFFKPGDDIQRISFKAASIEKNGLGENSERMVSVYLPPSYKESKDRFPCLYFLHGFTSNDEEINSLEIHELFDKAINDKLIPPMIVVFPNSDTKFKGSFYTNSAVSGLWSDYIGKDLITFIDSSFRTIKHKSARAVAGHSMGGNGALKVAMLFPEVFGSVYALSPSVLNWGEEFNLNNPSFEAVQNARDFKSLENDFYAMVFVGMGSTYSPNPSKPPFFCDMPVSFQNGVQVVDSTVLKLWENQFPYLMADRYMEGLKTLTEVGLDWGDKDDFKHIPPTCKAFAEKIRNNGIKCFAQEYKGTHSDRIGGFGGRIYTSLIPFLKRNLSKQ